MKLDLELPRNILGGLLALGILSYYPQFLGGKLALFGWGILWWLGSISVYSMRVPYSLYLFRNRDLLDIIFNLIIVTALPVIALSRQMAEYHSWYYSIYYVVAFAALEDLAFYLVHRLLHLPLLYRHIHYVHHRRRIVHPLYAQFSHPIETVLNAGTVALVNWILQPSLFDLYLITPLIILSNVSSHTYHKGNHGVHHEKFNANYGILNLSDYLFGTLQSEKK